MPNKIRNPPEEVIHVFDNKKWLYYNLEFPKSAYMKIQEILKEPIVSVKPLIRVIERCPRCKSKGIPKIERKDANDRRLRTEQFTSLGGVREKNKIHKKRSDEYWLTYDHKKTESKKCRILKFVSLQESREVKLNKKQGIILEEFIYPFCVSFLKRQYQNQILNKKNSQTS